MKLPPSSVSTGVAAVVLEVVPAGLRIRLSRKAALNVREAEEVPAYTERADAAPEETFGSLGNKLRRALKPGEKWQRVAPHMAAMVKWTASRGSMSQVPVWFERTFEFSLPLNLLPNLWARLRGTPARLEDVLSGCSNHTLTAKAQDTWSAQEHAGHLLDLEPLWLARVEDYVAGHDELTAADLTNRRTNEANHNTRPLQEILSRFRAARARLLKRAGDVDASLFVRTLPHPRLKTPMRLIDHLYFVAEHDDHHLARIWELMNPVQWRLDPEASVASRFQTIGSFLSYYETIRERTLRMVRLVPPDKLEWRHAPDVFSSGDLARHIAAVERYTITENVFGRPSRYRGCGPELADGLENVLAFMDRGMMQ